MLVISGGNNMNGCLIKDLKVLKKSSKEAVMGLEEMTEFKDYLHIKRNIEEDLLKKVKKSDKEDHSKLILVCGSVGDGKSHLLSIINNKYPKISKRFKFHNDATESRDPQKTFEDTLQDLLTPFNDNKYLKTNEKIILAINLGTLHNFMKSKQSNNLSILKSYLKKKKLINNYDVEINEKFDEYIEIVDFNEYEIFELEKNKLESYFIERLLKKITTKNENNIIRKSYDNCCLNCKISDKCPVKYNYEIFLDDKFKNYISQLIIKYIIKFKKIISVRGLLDFIFNIIVPNNLENIYNKKFDKIKKLAYNEKKFINYLSYNLIFNKKEVNNKFNKLNQIEPLNTRSYKIDLKYEKYRFDNKLKKDFKNNLDTKYIPLKTFLSEDYTIDEEVYNLLTKTIIREIITRNFNLIEDKIYNDYIKKLYAQNISNNKKVLKDLYKKVENAILNWNGVVDSRPKIFIGKKQEYYNYTKKIDISPDVKVFNGLDKYKFNKVLEISFENKKTDSKYEVNIDYKLYELIYKINGGYLPNKNDRDNHINYNEFVNKLIGKNADEIYIHKMNSKKKFKLSEDSFDGYEFIEVK